LNGWGLLRFFQTDLITGSSGSDSLIMIVSFRWAQRANLRALCSLSGSLPPEAAYYQALELRDLAAGIYFAEARNIAKRPGRQQEGSLSKKP
jgi:hypothetical protein